MVISAIVTWLLYSITSTIFGYKFSEAWGGVSLLYFCVLTYFAAHSIGNNYNKRINRLRQKGGRLIFKEFKKKRLMPANIAGAIIGYIIVNWISNAEITLHLLKNLNGKIMRRGFNLGRPSARTLVFGIGLYLLPLLIFFVSIISVGTSPDLMALNQRGIKHYDNGEYEKALEVYNNAMAKFPDVADLYTNRGNAYSKLKEYDKAIADHKKAIQLNPQLKVAYSNLGGDYVKIDEYDLAIEEYTNAIDRGYKEGGTYYGRGFSYYKTGQYDPAIKDFTVDIGKRPDVVYSYYFRGKCYEETGKPELARKDFEKVIELDPNSEFAKWSAEHLE